MLFEEPVFQPKKATRPFLPKEIPIDYEIGFLFNFVSAKSTRFDLEPVYITKRNKFIEYRRLSLQSEKALAWLQPLDDNLYYDFLQFSDAELIKWMNATGNKYIRDSNTGVWAHASARELKNLRKHYVDLLIKLWPRLSKSPNVFVLHAGKFVSHSQQYVSLGTEAIELRFVADREKDSVVLKLVVMINGNEARINVCGGFLIEHNNTLYLPPDADALAIIDLFKTGPMRFPLSMKKEIVKKYVLPWMEKYQMTIGEKLNVEVVRPAVQKRIRLSELNEANLMIRAEFLYDGEVVDYDQENKLVVEQGDIIKIIERNKEEEKLVHEFLRTLHPTFVNQRNNAYFYLPFVDVMKKGWFISMMRKVQEQDYSIHGFSELKKFRYTTVAPEFNIEATSTDEFFELKVTIKWGEQVVSLKEIRHAILNWQDTIMLEDGTLGHIPEEWVSQYSLILRTGKEENGVLKVNKVHYTFLEDILDKLDDKARQEIETRRRKLIEFDSLQKAPLSGEIKASLRPYQLSGFHWMQALDELSWGGCLADDMGLGKTLQTISFLQFLKEKYPGSTQLVVCPTSLIFNWESELHKFCPSLKFYIYYGLQREFNDAHFEEYDIVLTSYGVMRNDMEDLSNFLWQYIILDESQAIKNPDARVTRAVQQLRSVNRIILSGTPVQNNTFDLFSQFNFLNPGLLGNREFFNREFATPIDKFNSKEKAQHLRKLVNPFTLRRTKEQVAKDLPEKTITVLWCTMDAVQRKLYNEYRDGYRNKLLKKIDEEGIAKSGLDVLEGLLRLRQICDHPALVTKDDSIDSSVKIDELIREVTENAGNHKLLVFSQFTEMLKLIKSKFEEAGVSYCYLDGSTSLNNRKEEVNRFNEDESVKAFLISLKAGGVGLNLTVADYVYIVDPWWNPAAEAQAIDRAHRIGQKRNVFAYKMICKDSVEEKILQLQQRKKMLADDLIQEDSNFVKTLNRDDVEFLFG